VTTIQIDNPEPYELIPHEAIREYLAEADEYGSYPTREDFLAFAEVADKHDQEGLYRYAGVWAEEVSDATFAATVADISRAVATITASWDEYEDAWAEPYQPSAFWDDDPTHGTDAYDY